jgi:Ser/Thr protein kinase RdoA (MazF antagonist)
MTPPNAASSPHGLLVHGMGKGLVEPEWPALTGGELSFLASHYASLAASRASDAAAITWRSPRPMSAAALVRWPAHEVFVKRHEKRVRNATQLAAEHSLARHLRRGGLCVPGVLATAAGQTVLARGDYVYEVHEVAAGVDLYRDAVSWSPFRSPGHAWAAGDALARLHEAAADFRCPARPPGVLVNSCQVIIRPDPLAAVGRLLRVRPGLGRYLGARRWQDDFSRYLLPAIVRAAPLLAPLERQWGHGDWHPSNLTWTSAGADAEVVAIFDFGLANRTFAVHDLAIALERSAVAWLDLAESGHADVDFAGLDALLDGYESVRPLRRQERAALAEVLPVVHLEYALSEVEYFADVVKSAELADLAYETYLLGHARWFDGPEGSALLGHLRRRAPG